jgi:SH3-like domain-containing protein
MKIKNGLILAAMLSTTLGAQTVTNTAPPALLPPPISTAPAAAPPPALDAGPFSADTNQPGAKPAKSAKKKSAKSATRKKAKPAAGPDLEITIVPNEPAAPKQDHVNVRGRAGINSEVVTHLNRSDTVTVLDVITIKPKADEPAKWAKITLPPGAHAWVNTSFLDGATKTVVPAKLNIRSGPGENYSVIGLMHKGDAVKDLSTKGEWTEIEAPPNSYAFVAAHLLAKKEATAAPVAEPTPTPVPPPVASVASNPVPSVPPATETPVVAVPPPANPPPTLLPQPIVTTPLPQPIVTTPAPVAPPVAPPDEGPAVPRVVEREGIVRGTVSIQAPTHFELESLDTHKVIDYLHTTSTNLLLRRYRGMTVLVSGEEGLDERWPNTPVITVQRIQVVQ